MKRCTLDRRTFTAPDVVVTDVVAPGVVVPDVEIPDFLTVQKFKGFIRHHGQNKI